MPKLILTLSIVGLIALAVPSQAQDSRLELLTRTLMSASGLDKQIEQIPQTIHAGLRQLEQRSHDLPIAQLDSIREAVEATYDARQLANDTRRYLKENLSVNEIKAVLDWLNAPLGRKITEAENALAAPDAFAEAEKMRENTDSHSARLAKLARLDEAVKGTETTLSLLLNSDLALARAIGAAIAPDREDLLQNLASQAKQRSGKLRPKIARQTHTLWLYAYESLSDEELDEYINFAQSDLGVKYHDRMFAAAEAAMVSASRKMGELIAAKLKSAR